MLLGELESELEELKLRLWLVEVDDILSDEVWQELELRLRL
jgi:hypothetical protein